MPAVAKQSASPRKHRRGTNIRQRQAQIGVRLTPEEYAAVKATADSEGRSPASVLRRAFFKQTEAAT